MPTQNMQTTSSHSPGTFHTQKVRKKRSPKSHEILIFHFSQTGPFGERTLLTASRHVQNRTFYCPETHFQCHDDLYCLPVYVRCNGVYDCPGREDEQSCRDAACPGYYRCRGSAVCLHPEHVCDGYQHCPEQDDELLCELYCPAQCLCLGLAFKCNSTFQLPLTLRALDVSGSSVTPHQLLDFVMLVYLDLSNCNLTTVTHISFPNLQTLSFRRNSIRNIRLKDLTRVSNLRHLYLSQNPMTALFPPDANSSLSLSALKTLDVSGIPFHKLDVSILDSFPELHSLNLSNTGVVQLLSSRRTPLSKLQVIDLRGCSVLKFPPRLFRGLDNLQQVFGDTFKLCCPQVLPAGFNPSNCHAPVSEISSCDNLLRSNVYRLFLTVFAIFALSGNVFSLLFRLCGSKVSKGSGYSVFVTHLCMSDGLMGVYLAVVGVADKVYQNNYLWQDITWKNSVLCKTAGFLALLSTEMSAFIICFITLDRFLVIRFPFSQLRFQPWSAHTACCLHWLVLVFVATVPFFPAHTHWGFYSHTDICIPLPITRSSFAGHSFAFGVMIVLNMVLFVAIAVGQTAIYSAIRTNTLSSTDTSRKQQDLNIARRLITIAATDFLCWFPVGLLGLLAATGTAVPGEVNVAMATLVIPLNSAMNPFLYTMNVLLEQRRQAKEERILHYLKSRCLNV